MKVFFLIQGWDVAASRYRVLNYIPYLKDHDVITRVDTYPTGVKEFYDLYRDIGGYDVLFLQRKRFNPPFLQLVRQKAKGIVYDFDDAVMYRNSTAPSPYSRTRQRRFARIVRTADYVIAGNNFLRDQAARFTNRVKVIPTAIDRNRYQAKDYTTRKKRVTIGWIGDHGSIHYLEKIRHIFEELGGILLSQGFEVLEVYRTFHASVPKYFLRLTLFYPLRRILNVDFAKSIVILADKRDPNCIGVDK